MWITKDSPKNGHPDHSDKIKNLNRAAGQIEGIKKMIEEKRYCPDILTQIRAARSALKSIESAILESHLNICVEEAISSGDKKKANKKMAELVEIFKRYEA